MDQAQLTQLFGGAPEEPVPQVDPEDVKAVWELGREVKKDHPDGQVAIGMQVFEHACKPGAIVKAVIYRTSKIEMLRCIAPELMEPLIQDKLEAGVCRSRTGSDGWIGVGIVHKGWAFDVLDFMRRAREAA